MHRSPRRAVAAVLSFAVVGAVSMTACGSPPDHPELAVQQSDSGAFVVLYNECGEDLEQIRLVEVWGELEQDMLVATGDDLIAPTTEGGPTTVFVPRNAMPPRLRIEVEGSDPFETEIDPDDVPPEDFEVLVPEGAPGEEVVRTEDFATRCA